MSLPAHTPFCRRCNDTGFIRLPRESRSAVLKEQNIDACSDCTRNAELRWQTKIACETLELQVAA